MLCSNRKQKKRSPYSPSYLWAHGNIAHIARAAAALAHVLTRRCERGESGLEERVHGANVGAKVLELRLERRQRLAEDLEKRENESK